MITEKFHFKCANCGEWSVESNVIPEDWEDTTDWNADSETGVLCSACQAKERDDA